MCAPVTMYFLYNGIKLIRNFF